MIDFLYKWQEAIFGSIAILIALLAIYFQLRKKALACRIIVNESILSVPEEEKEKIDILFEDKKVPDVQLLVLKFFNNGKLPIRSDDFEGPFKIFLGKNTKILSCDISDSVPKRLRETLTVTAKRHPESYVSIPPFLLNHKNSFSIKLLLTNFDGTIDFCPQIAGISEVKKLVMVEGHDWFYSLSGMLIGLYVWAFIFFRFLIPEQDASTGTMVIYFSDLLIIGLGIVFGFAGYALGPALLLLVQSIKRNKRL